MCLVWRQSGEDGLTGISLVCSMVILRQEWWGKTWGLALRTVKHAWHWSANKLSYYNFRDAGRRQTWDRDKGFCYSQQCKQHEHRIHIGSICPSPPAPAWIPRRWDRGARGGCASSGIASLLRIPELKEPESFILDNEHFSPLILRETLFLLTA